MNEKSTFFFNSLKKAVETDQLTLPTLPDVAIKIREAVEQENNSAQQIADIITQDASLTARLLQVANSPLYRARSEISELSMAVTRLGTRVVRDLIICLAMKQIFQPSSDTLKKQFHELWITSTEVAAISRLIARDTSLNPEQALIAGLIHNIGALPVLEMAEHDIDLANNKQALQQIIEDVQGPVGKLILSFWNFPNHLVEVVSSWNDFQRAHDGAADYVDVVQIAILQSEHNLYTNLPEDWNQIPAFSAMGISPDSRIIDEPHYKSTVDETRQSLLVM